MSVLELYSYYRGVCIIEMAILERWPYLGDVRIRMIYVREGVCIIEMSVLERCPY